MEKLEDGILYVTLYSYNFKNKIREIAKQAQTIARIKKLKGIGVFIFGSCARQEMVEESDADIMIIREKNNLQYKKFREEFRKLLEKENFEKIDLPEWGNYEDCEEYLKESITEGNQVKEAKFIYGDNQTNEYIESLKNKFNAKKRAEKVFCFQKLYFDQYYIQRTKRGIKNVKYGHGGTRDLMFLNWYAEFLEKRMAKKVKDGKEIPDCYRVLKTLYKKRLIDSQSYKEALKSMEILIRLRNEVLLINKKTSARGLTYLDKKTISSLFIRKVFYKEARTEKELKKRIEKDLENIKKLKNNLWKLYLGRLKETKGEKWTNNFRKILKGDISLEQIKKMEIDDELSQMAIIWKIKKKKNKLLFRHIFDTYSQSDKWTILSSICCHPDCPTEVLESIALRIIDKKSHGYILKIIGRNANTSKETLKKIAHNQVIEERFKQPAIIAYEHGTRKANELR